MAKGNWNCNVVKPKARCRYCARVVRNADFVRVEGVYPAHRVCATERGKRFTEGKEINPENMEGYGLYGTGF